MSGSTQLLTIFIALCLFPIAHAVAPSDGETTQQNENEVWNDDGLFNGHHIISTGSTLTITSNISMEYGSSITVEEGAVLEITQGSLFSEDVDSGRFLNQFGASVTVGTENIGQQGKLKLTFDHELGPSVVFNASYLETQQDMAGTQSIEFDVDLNGSNHTIFFSTTDFTPTYLTQIQFIYGGAQTITILPNEMEAVNAPLYWFDYAFELVVNGTLNVDESTVYGASISCAGTCTVTSSHLIGSSPIDVSSSGQFGLIDSTIQGSRTDEDIILNGDATISYINSSGTGSTTDRWVRLLNLRLIHTNIPNGSVHVEGIGYGGDSWDALTDENGTLMLVDSGEINQHKRMISWMDGAGTIHHEEATISVSTATTAWGTYSVEVNAPINEEATITVPLPLVTVSSLGTSDVVATVNKSVGLMLTVENLETVSTTANFRCYVDGIDADTAPSTITANIPAGESITIPISWYEYSSGDKILECKPFLPTAFDSIADQLADLNGAKSQPVAWSYAEDVDETPIITIVVVILGFLGLAIFVTRRKEQDDPTEKWESEPEEMG